MKRHLLFLLLLGFSVAGMAQTTPVKTKIKSATTTVQATPAKEVTKKKTAVTTAAATPATAAVKTTTTTTTTAKLKKDGTPDMRVKENKEAAAKKVPVKKDGTPDMRYKANKKKG
jgi:uncharacterized cupredoxin-like copper-binding protein